jgi:hypothetical protein
MVAELRTELAELGFEDHRRELEEFLTDREGYVARHAPRVVARLVELGRRARAERAVARAAACFNRALAYRPDDLELLRLVSGLAKAERLRRSVRRVVRRGALAAAGLGALAFGVARSVGPTPAHHEAPSPARPVAARAARSAASRPPPRAPSRRRPAGSAATVRHGGRRQPASPLAAIKATPRSLARRPVKVVISGGAIGGYVVVDGARLSSGESRDLVVGQKYTFVFRPPDDNADCCAITTKTVEIGEDTAVVEDDGAVRSGDHRRPPTRPRAAGSTAGWRGPATTPAAMRVTFNNEPLIPVTCSLVPPSGSGLPPREKSAELTPGAVV